MNLALMTESSKEILKKLIEIEKMNYILKLKSDDQWRTIIGHVMIKYLLAKKMNTRLNNIRISYSIYGKPFVENCIYNFNISHSGEYIVCAISNNSVGIDIEEEIIDYDNILDIVCTNKEVELVRGSLDPKKIFTKLWVLKESYLKAIGKGFYNDPKTISFKFINDEIISNKSGCRFKLFTSGNIYLATCELL